MTTETIPRPAPGIARLPWNTLQDAPYVPSDRQAEWHAASERYKLYGGAVGGGKTTALAVESLLLSWQYKGNEGIVGRRDFDDLRRTTYAEVLKWCPPELIRQHHRSEHWLELINGSVMHFMELKDSGGLKNLNLGWFAIDQAEEVPYESYMWLQSRLRRAGVDQYFGLLSANPELGWVKDTFVDQRIDGHVFVPALPEDNPHLPADYVEGLLSRWPDTYVRKLLRGSWDVVENAIYPQLDRRKHLIPCDARQVWSDGAIGVDYGDVHPHAVVAVSRASTGRLWVREVWTGHDYDELFSTMGDFKARYKIHKVRVDPMLKGWERLIRVERADSSPGSRKNRIELITRLLNANALSLDVNGADMDGLYTEMVGYRWDIHETDTATVRQPVRKNDDRVAALEYAIEELEGANTWAPRVIKREYSQAEPAVKNTWL